MKTKKKIAMLKRLQKVLQKDPKAIHSTAGLLRHFNLQEIADLECALQSAVDAARAETVKH